MAINPRRDRVRYKGCSRRDTAPLQEVRAQADRATVWSTRNSKKSVAAKAGKPIGEAWRSTIIDESLSTMIDESNRSALLTPAEMDGADRAAVAALPIP